MLIDQKLLLEAFVEDWSLNWSSTCKLRHPIKYLNITGLIMKVGLEIDAGSGNCVMSIMGLGMGSVRNQDVLNLI